MAYDDLTSGGFYPDPGDGEEITEDDMLEFTDLYPGDQEYVLNFLTAEEAVNHLFWFAGDDIEWTEKTIAWEVK